MTLKNRGALHKSKDFRFPYLSGARNGVGHSQRENGLEAVVPRESRRCCGFKGLFRTRIPLSIPVERPWPWKVSKVMRGQGPSARRRVSAYSLVAIGSSAAFTADSKNDIVRGKKMPARKAAATRTRYTVVDGSKRNLERRNFFIQKFHSPLVLELILCDMQRG